MTPIITPEDLAVQERFFAKTTLNGITGCLEWTAAHLPEGYGLFWHLGKSVQAHRFAFERDNGPIPDGLIVRHSCDNPTCVRSGHLLTGTRADNRADMLERMRTQKPDAPLTEPEREYIRAWVDEHGGTVEEAAYGLGGVHLGTARKGLRLGREAWERLEFTAFLDSFMPFLDRDRLAAA
jgi:hypothetical protein